MHFYTPAEFKLGRSPCLRPETLRVLLAFPHPGMKPLCCGLAASKTLSHSNGPVSPSPSCSSPGAEQSWSCPHNPPRVPNPTSRSRLCGHKVGVAQRGQAAGGGRGGASDAAQGRGWRDCVPGAAVRGWRGDAGGQPPESLQLRGAGASTPAPASCGGGATRHPLGQGPHRLSKQPVRISAGALGRCAVTALSLCLFLLLPPEIPLDQRLLSHPQMD